MFPPKPAVRLMRELFPLLLLILYVGWSSESAARQPSALARSPITELEPVLLQIVQDDGAVAYVRLLPGNELRMEYLETGLAFSLRPIIDGEMIDIEVFEVVAKGTVHERLRHEARARLRNKDDALPPQELLLGAVHRVALSVVEGHQVHFDASGMDNPFPLPDPEEQRPHECCIYCNGVLYCACAVQTSCGSCCIGFCC